MLFPLPSIGLTVGLIWTLIDVEEEGGTGNDVEEEGGTGDVAVDSLISS